MGERGEGGRESRMEERKVKEGIEVGRKERARKRPLEGREGRKRVN